MQNKKEYSVFKKFVSMGWISTLTSLSKYLQQDCLNATFAHYLKQPIDSCIFNLIKICFLILVLKSFAIGPLHHAIVNILYLKINIIVIF